MKHRQWATLLALMIIATQLFAQGKITGRVYDKNTGASIEYATIAVLNAKDSALVTGTVTEGNGTFTVKAAYGRYLVRVSFMGYETHFYPK